MSPGLRKALMAFAIMAMAFASNAIPVDQPLPIDLRLQVDSFQLEDQLFAYVDETGLDEVNQVASHPEKFSNYSPTHRFPLAQGKSVWIWINLRNPKSSSTTWTLNIPIVIVDRATLFQKDERGSWNSQSWGDSIEQASRASRTFYPDFRLLSTPDASVPVLLRVQNYTHINIPIRIVPQSQREHWDLLETIFLGLVLGLLLVMAIHHAILFVEFMNWADAWASVFGLLITITFAQFNGVLNATLWASIPLWGDYASSTLSVVALGATVLLIRHIYTFAHQNPRLYTLMRIVGWATIASVLSFAFTDRVTADNITAFTMLASITIALYASLANLRTTASSEARLLTFAILPQFLIMMVVVSEAFAFVPTFWQLRYILSAAIALSVPLILRALDHATHLRKELHLRSQQPDSLDALTGLMSLKGFTPYLQNAYYRVLEHREPKAVVLIRNTNYDYVHQTYGEQTSESCIVRAVVKLHRILRDVDPAARVSAASFAVILEGASNQKKVTERMVKLIASGLIPLPGFEPEILLHFHVAVVMLHANPIEPDKVLGELNALLDTYSPRTRRPIRFLEPPMTQPASISSVD